MITEDYISFETAKLLKEKEFPVKEVQTWYCEFDGYPDKNIVTNKQYPQITLQMAMKWLREVHNLVITIDYDLYEMPFGKDKVGYGYSIQRTTNPAEFFKIGEYIYDYYEEACEAAVKDILENLI